MEQSKPKNGPNIYISVDSSELDAAIEKANRLTELLREASDIIDSLAGRNSVDSADVISDRIIHCLRSELNRVESRSLL